VFTLQAVCPSGVCTPREDGDLRQRCPLLAGNTRGAPEYLSATQVQRELGVSHAQLQELIASGKLHAFQLCGQWRIERRMLDLMIDELYELSARMLALPSPHPREPDACAGVAAESAGGPVASVERRSLRSETQQSPRWTELTQHQRQITALVGAGLSNAEIATRMSLEVSTVKTHVSRILQRTALRDREQLIVAAWRSGFMGGESWDQQPAPDARPLHEERAQTSA
jgi:DNA-binding CsgD family transcriptional regulator